MSALQLDWLQQNLDGWGAVSVLSTYIPMRLFIGVCELEFIPFQLSLCAMNKPLKCMPVALVM